MTLIFLYMGLILVGYMEHLVHICPIYEHNSPHVSVLYDLGTVLARVRGGATISKQSTFQIFPNFGRGGGSSKINFFPNSKKSKLSQGGGSRKLWTFSTIWDIFFLEGSPNVMPVTIWLQCDGHYITSYYHTNHYFYG